MRHIDLETLKEVHNALDDIRLGNYDLAIKQLNKIVSIKQLTIPFIVKKSEQCDCGGDENKCPLNIPFGCGWCEKHEKWKT